MPVRLRSLLFAPLCVVLLAACAAHPAVEQEKPRQPTQSPPPLQRLPLSNYLPAPGVTWLVQLAPRELSNDSRLRKDWQQVFATERLKRFGETTGFVLTDVEEIWIAGYPLGTLFVFDARKVGPHFEDAFRTRSRSVRELSTQHPDLVHLTAIVDDAPQALVHLRGHFIAVVQNDISLAKVVRAVALGKLGHVPRASATRFLKPFEDFEQDAPLRLFLAGPFPEASDAVTQGFVSGVAAVRTTRGQLEARLAALGIWDDDDATPGQIESWVHQVLGTREMRALGLGFPEEIPQVRCEPTEVVPNTPLSMCRATGSWNSRHVAEAIHRTTEAPLSEMLPETNPSSWTPVAHPDRTSQPSEEHSPEKTLPNESKNRLPTRK